MQYITRFLLGFLAMSAIAANSRTVQPVIPFKAEAFPLTDVRLLDGPFWDAMLLDRQYLLSLDADRLLHTFRLNVKLPSTAKPLGGWEAPGCELRGHNLGHYLTACALMYSSTGDASLKAKADGIVSELAKCQEASSQAGFNKGYLSAYPESFIDRVETRKPVWAPWYTLHKIYAGLLDVYQQCNNAQALEVMVKAADWIQFRVDRLTPEQMQASLEMEFGGMNEVLANLYAITGDPRHLKLAQAFDHKKVFDPLARQEDRLNGLHANTQIPKMIGAAREYELTGEARYHDIATTFWDRVALHRSYANGGHSDAEHFFPIEQFNQHLSPVTCETCNTYNMLKLTRHLFKWEPNALEMDFYERALYNHILASQDPKTGMFVYFLSLKPGHFKTYSQPENSFWCCVGSGMENHAKYGESIYFHNDSTLFLNLFIASELSWKAKGLSVRQETAFPQSDSTKLTFKCENPVNLTLNVRYPSWAQSGMIVLINGKKQDVKGVPGSYVAIQRQWKNGDKVEVRLPMSLRVEPLPGDKNTVALLYGPIVLAGGLGTNGLPNLYAHDQNDLNKVPSPTVPVFVGDSKGLLKQVVPVAGKALTFATKNLGRPNDVVLTPLYQMHHQRYSVYWKLLSEDAWKSRMASMAMEETKRKEQEARLVDAVNPGEQQPETDHKMAGENTQSGEHQGRKWRDARGGWFSYEVKTSADQPIVLCCTYWGGDAGGRVFDILVDGQKIATQTLENNKPGEFFDVTYPIPANILAGKSKITVKFQAQQGRAAGGLFGVKILREK